MNKQLRWEHWLNNVEQNIGFLSTPLSLKAIGLRVFATVFGSKND
tara:strand:- start:7049 stop:7183 length:135 start_codon:yes stop_codon:yes gene_type:complete